MLFLASGTHGVEGLCGSGIQHFLLRDGVAARVPDDVALVLLHAVNPFGFAWLRRVNEDNVDLNRNFLDHAAPHPENADYDGLADAVNPSVRDEGTIICTPDSARAASACCSRPRPSRASRRGSRTRGGRT